MKLFLFKNLAGPEKRPYAVIARNFPEAVELYEKKTNFIEIIGTVEHVETVDIIISSQKQ